VVVKSPPPPYGTNPEIEGLRPAEEEGEKSTIGTDTDGGVTINPKVIIGITYITSTEVYTKVKKKKRKNKTQ
jgi:hypothetical protein